MSREAHAVENHRAHRAADARTSVWIARRYLFARIHGYATFINWVSFVGLALGVMILTVVLSVMNGFDREITSRILSAVPHAVVEYDGRTPAERLLALDGIAGVSRYYQGEAMLPRGGGVGFVVLAGLDAEGARRLPELVRPQDRERLFDQPGGIILGAVLADHLGVQVGDPVYIVTALPVGGGVRARTVGFRLAGTFEVGAEPDATLALVRHADIVTHGLTDAGLDGWRIHFDDPFEAPALADAIRDVLGPNAAVSFWMDDYGELFRAVKIEKAIMFVLLALIVAIASLNIVSGQAMLVNNKRGDVAMLATMGASRGLLVGVFFLQGFSIAVIGVAVGLATGIVVALHVDSVAGAFEGYFGASLIDGTWFGEIPSRILVSDLVAITALSLGLGLVAVLRPAFKATAENPAEALHSG